MTRSHSTAAYDIEPGRHDEMVDAPARTNAAWVHLGEVVDQRGSAGRADQLARSRRTLRAHGATFDPSGRHDLASSLDPVPVLLQRTEWDDILEGLGQRARTISAIVDDVFGDQQLVRRGLLPPEIMFDSVDFLRPLVGAGPMSRSGLVLYAADLARTGDGRFVVLADRTQAPTGLGHALENRRVVRSLFPEFARRVDIEPLVPWFERVRAALAQCGLATEHDPRIVMLCAGDQSDAAFEDGFLASTLGYTLVQGPDLTVRGGRVWLKSVSGLERVDVINRRVPDLLCDPLELRSDSVGGVAGLVECARRGTVEIGNPLGSSFGENPGLAPFFAGMVRDLLGEDPILDQPESWWCGEPSGLDHVIKNIDDLVVRSIGRSSGGRSRFGRTLSSSERDDLVSAMRARPHRFVAQAEVQWATTPLLHEDGLVPTPMMVRAFLVADAADRAPVGQGTWHGMPGGLVRTGVDPSAVSLTEGGPSKDLWILDPGNQRDEGRIVRPQLRQVDLRSSIPSRAAEGLFWVGRNLERAELVVRLVESVSGALDSSPELETEANGAWLMTVESLVESVIGAPPDRARTPDASASGVSSQLDSATGRPERLLTGALCDETRPISLATSLRFLLGSANSVRELFAMTMWEVLADLAEDLEGLRSAWGVHHGSIDDDADVDLDRRSRRIMIGLAAMSGLIGESMVRDPGWWFMDIGRRIERSLLLIRTTIEAVGHKPDEQIAASVHHTLLASWDSLVTYRRRHRSDVVPADLLSLLITDPSNPRSLQHQLHRLHGDVGFLPALDTTSPGLRDQLAALLARVEDIDTEMLAAADTSGRRPQLTEELESVEVELRAVASDLNLSYFARVEGVAVGVDGAFDGEVT